MPMSDENREWARDALGLLDAVIQEDGPGPVSEQRLTQRLTQDPNESVEAALSKLLVGMAMLANLVVLMRKHDGTASTSQTISELAQVIAPQPPGE